MKFEARPSELARGESVLGQEAMLYVAGRENADGSGERVYAAE